MAKKQGIKPNTSTLLPLNKYDHVIVSFSGGKDSLACLLHVLELGAPKARLELWHQAVDGRPGVDERFFDWPCTESYCRQVAEVVGVPLRFQWREGGYLGELMKGTARQGGPFTLHTSVLTAYFRIDPNGRVWVTKRSANATQFGTYEEALAARNALPQEDVLVPRFFDAKELEDIRKEIEELRSEATTDEELGAADEEERELRAPAIMPPLDMVNVTTPVPTAMNAFELSPNGAASGNIGQAGGKGAPGVRLQFPAPTAVPLTRWCSSLLKMDVAQQAITNDPRYAKGSILMVTGERRQESENRSHYAEIIRHKSTTNKRRVDQWRAILDWPEERIWEIIQRWRIRPHPAYYLGFGRVSCFPCIFSNPDQWASIRTLAPQLFNRILEMEAKFNKTIQEGGSVQAQAARGSSYVPNNPQMISAAFSEHLPRGYAVVPASETWTMPAGAFKKTGGPT